MLSLCLFLCSFVYLKICLFWILLALFIIPHLLLHVALLWSLPLSWFLGNGSRSVHVKYHRIYDHVGGDLSHTQHPLLTVLSVLGPFSFPLLCTHVSPQPSHQARKS